MIAALPMYDRPELQEINDQLWAGMRDALGYGPEQLTRDKDLFEVWEDPDLIFAQTCSLPYRLYLHDKVQLIGSPDYGLPDTPKGHYYSVLVARKDDLRDLQELYAARVLINQTHSQSGHATLWEKAEDLGLSFTRCGESGGHLNSARMVASGEADLAALDALSWRLMQRYDDFAQDLRVLTQTRPTAAMPYICGVNHQPDQIARAFRIALNGLSAEQQNAIGVYDLIPLPCSAYTKLAVPAAISSL